MKASILLLFLSVALSSFGQNDLAQHGPFIGAQGPLGVVYGKNNRILITENVGGIWYTDDRQTWQTSKTYLPGISSTIVKDEDDNLFVFNYSTIYKSHDNGENWSPYTAVLGNGTNDDALVFVSTARDLGIAGDTAFVAHDAGLGYLLLDGTNVGRAIHQFDSKTIAKIAVNHNTIVAAESNAGLHFSFDRGATWTHRDVPFSNPVQEILIVDNKLWIRAFEIWYSDDWGTTWNKKNNGLAGADHFEWAQGKLYATNGGLYSFSEANDSWSEVIAPDGRIRVCIAGNDQRLFTGIMADIAGIMNNTNLDPGHFRESSDGGTSWSDVGLGGYTNGVIRQLAIDADGNMFAATSNFIFKKKYGASQFKLFASAGNAGMVVDDVNHRLYIGGNGVITVYDIATGNKIPFTITYEPGAYDTDRLVKTGDDLFLSSQTGGVWHGVENGGITSFNTGLTSLHVRELRVVNQTLYAATDIGLFKTGIQTAAWQKVYPTSGNDVIVTMAIHDNSIVVSAAHNSAVSNDGGVTWQKIDALIDAPYDIAYNNGSFYTIGFGQSWVSINGTDWVGRLIEKDYKLFGWSVLPLADSVYFGTAGQGILAYKNSAFQTINFPQPPDRTMGDPPFSIGATSSAGLAITYTTEQTTKISFSGDIATILSPGRVGVRASQPGNADVPGAIPVQRYFCINPAKPTITTSGEPGSMLLTSSAGDQYQWYHNGAPISNATDKTTLRNDGGKFSVKIATYEGCSSVMSDEITITLPTKVSGTVTLDVGSDFRGVTVSFIATSPSAKDTSVMTSYTGGFLAILKPGTYTVTFTKAGFDTITIPDTFFNEPVSLGIIAMSSKPIVNICGDIHGVNTWTSDFVYNINCNVNVFDDLTIEAGTMVTFSPAQSMNIYGNLHALGTALAPILITSSNFNKQPGDWKSMYFGYGSKSDLHYTTIEFGGGPVNAENSSSVVTSGDLTLDHCAVQYSHYNGVTVSAGNIAVDHSLFQHNYWSGMTVSADKGTIINSEFRSNTIFGFINGFSTDLQFSGNVVHDNNYGLETFSAASIENNIFYSNTYGAFVTQGIATITRNSFYNNTYGVGIYDSSIALDAQISSNIFAGNTGSAIHNNSLIWKPTVVKYNLFHGNGNIINAGPAGVGVIVTTNINGSAADTFYNFFEDPDFVSTAAGDLNFLYLEPGSPAIDSGDPQLKDADGSIADVGAIPFQKLNQQVIFNPIPSLTYGDDAMELVATSTSDLAVTFESSDTSIAKIEGGQLVILSGGTVTITALQDGNTLYKATEATQTVTIVKRSQSILPFSISDKTLGVPAFTVKPEASSHLDVNLTASNDKVSIVGTLVSLVNAGRVTITGRQDGDNRFMAAEPLSSTFCINPAKPSITVSGVPPQPVLTSSNAAGNQWYHEGTAIPGATNATFHVTDDGVYSVKTTVDDCTSLPSDDVTVKIVGLKDEWDAEVKLFPNPTHKDIFLRSTEAGSVTVVDITGRVIHSRAIDAGTDNLFDVQHLASGIYFVRIEVSGKLIIRSFAKL